ncbi:unnamed protein product, partial [marine sediment metagenome]
DGIIYKLNKKEIQKYYVDNLIFAGLQNERNK